VFGGLFVMLCTFMFSHFDFCPSHSGAVALNLNRGPCQGRWVFVNRMLKLISVICEKNESMITAL